MKNIFRTVILGACFIVPLIADAQCKGFVKRQCLPQLSPYIHNGQMNTTTLLSGDNAELSMTFYSGQNYRILVCTQDVLGKANFKLKDVNNNVVFSSKDHKDASFWDFNVESTQQLTIEVAVPDTDSKTGIIPSGCVSIMVGFKQ